MVNIGVGIQYVFSPKLLGQGAAIREADQSFVCPTPLLAGKITRKPLFTAGKSLAVPIQTRCCFDVDPIFSRCLANVLPTILR